MGQVIFGPHADVNGTRAGLEKGFVAAGVGYKVLLKRLRKPSCLNNSKVNKFQ